MKLALVALLLFVVVFAETVVIDYPVFITRFENSTRAVVPWDVEDVHGFTSEVKNPVPGEYLLIGRREQWILSRESQELLEALRSEGITLGGIRTTTSTGWPVGINIAANVTDKDKFLAILKTDTNFANILPVDVSDKIDNRIWNNGYLVYDPRDSSKIWIYVVFRVRNSSSMSVEEIERIIEILKDLDCRHGNMCYEVSSIERWGVPPVFATFEQVAELAKNPFVSFIGPSYPIVEHMESARSLSGVDILQQNLQNTFDWITPFVGWLEDSLYGRVGIHTGAGITVSINEHPAKLRRPSNNDIDSGYRHLDFTEIYHVIGDTLIRTPSGPVVFDETFRVQTYAEWKNEFASEWYLSRHGIRVAGVLAGNGRTYNQGKRYRGIAPGVMLYAMGDSGHVNNYSIDSWKQLGGFHYYPYHEHNDTTDSRYGRIGVFAAGNTGDFPNLILGIGGVMSLAHEHKNGIVVGATHKDEKLITSSSSVGPSTHGMIKPDIVAPGGGYFSTGLGGIITTYDNFGYTSRSNNPYAGTSYSAPVVSGIVALMLQKYRDGILAEYNRANTTNFTLRGYPMWNSTARAILIHTAIDMIDTVGIGLGRNASTMEPIIYDKGPDWATGWGFVDAVRAVNYVNTERFRQDTISQGDTNIYYMFVPENKPFRITTAWDDPFINEDTNTWRLQNNIDTYAVRRIGNTVTNTGRPWTLDPTPITAAKFTPGVQITTDLIRRNPARRGVDSLNTVEVIDVETLPAYGMWEVMVIGKEFKMQQNPIKDGVLSQNFSIVTDHPIGRAFVPFDTVLTLENMLNFRHPNAWRAAPNEPWTTLRPNYASKNRDTITPVLDVISTHSFSTLISNLPVDKYVGSNVESIIMGVSLSFPKNPANLYRGNLQILFGHNWVGQFDINSYGHSVQLNRSTDEWFAYYELILPNHAVAALKQSPQEITMRFSAIRDNAGSFTLRQVEFIEREGENDRDLMTELTKIANNTIMNPNGLTVLQIKELACDYLLGLPPLGGLDCSPQMIFYRDLLDPQVNRVRRFYFQIRQDVNAPMQFVEWWAFIAGYDPQVPWNSTSFWRQCWTYLGVEDI